MTENEQIAEMAKIAAKSDDTCRAATVAKGIYNAGYRKVERGEWIEKTHDWDFGDYIDYTCSICGIREQNKRKFCPECGADMRGE